MKSLKILGVLFLLNILLTSCGSGSKVAVALQGNTWKLVKVIDQKVPASSKAQIVFNANLSVNGSSGVNRFVGQYKLSDSTGLSFSPLASTKMASLSAEDSAIEDKFFQAISQTKKYTIKGQQLTFLNEKGKTVAVFQATAK